jgi:pyridoxal/pyridoxine/pyridoxamine kinase
MKTSNNTVLLKEACGIISDNLGDKMAENFRTFYQDDSTEEIIHSLRALLSGLVGENSTKQQLAELVSKYQ